MAYIHDAGRVRGSPGPTQDQGVNVVKLVLRDRESIQEAVRRFRKLVEGVHPNVSVCQDAGIVSSNAFQDEVPVLLT